MILRISTCNVLFCKFVLLIRLFKNFTETKILIDILMGDCFSLPLRWGYSADHCRLPHIIAEKQISTYSALGKWMQEFTRFGVFSETF
jgi:hypothetical protein